MVKLTFSGHLLLSFRLVQRHIKVEEIRSYQRKADETKHIPDLITLERLLLYVSE